MIKGNKLKKRHKLSNILLRIVNRLNTSKDWRFEGEFRYIFQFKVSFPINAVYKETGIINVVVPANNAKKAKIKLTKFVKDKIQITVVNMKKC
jgi:hypothetical protein